MLPLNVFEPAFADRLASAGLRCFDDFWNLEWNWVEPRNERRAGWSGATRVRIETSESPLSLFVKRQENHCYRSVRHPLRGRPTFYREWCNIQRLLRGDVPTLDPVYYGERIYEGRYQAILVSLALDGFCELDELFRQRENLVHTQRAAALKAAAETIARFHQNGLRHNCLGGNHLMMRINAQGEGEARILDLEKVKAVRNKNLAVVRDLARFIRHTPTLSAEDHLELMRAYTDAHPFANLDQLVAKVNGALKNKHTRHGRAAHAPLDQP